MREKRVSSGSPLVFLDSRSALFLSLEVLTTSLHILCVFCPLYVLYFSPLVSIFAPSLRSNRFESLESHQRRVYMYRILASSLFFSLFLTLFCLLPAHKTAWMWHEIRWYMTWHHLVTPLGFYASFHPSMQLFCLSSSVSFMSCVWIESRKQFFHLVSFLLHPLFFFFSLSSSLIAFDTWVFCWCRSWIFVLCLRTSGVFVEHFSLFFCDTNCVIPLLLLVWHEEWDFGYQEFSWLRMEWNPLTIKTSFFFKTDTVCSLSLLLCNPLSFFRLSPLLVSKHFSSRSITWVTQRNFALFLYTRERERQEERPDFHRTKRKRERERFWWPHEVTL